MAFLCQGEGLSAIVKTSGRSGLKGESRLCPFGNLLATSRAYLGLSRTTL
jgi:hypothetical protein